MSKQQVNGEGKRLKWAALILIPVMFMCGGTVGYTASVDTRVRVVEQDNAANGPRYKAIEASLKRIEADIKDMQTRKEP